MRIVFMGTPDFAVGTLEKIIENLDVALKNSALISKVDLCGQSTNIGEMIMKIKQDKE